MKNRGGGRSIGEARRISFTPTLARWPLSTGPPPPPLRPSGHSVVDEDNSAGYSCGNGPGQAACVGSLETPVHDAEAKGQVACQQHGQGQGAACRVPRPTTRPRAGSASWECAGGAGVVAGGGNKEDGQ